MENHINITEKRIYCADTDMYGVMWHGNYIRLFEAGRIEFLDDFNINIDDIYEKYEIALPVVEVNIKYRHIVKNGDRVNIKTKIKELKPHYMIFEQSVNSLDDKVMAEGFVKCVGVNKEGRIVRNLPDYFKPIEE